MPARIFEFICRAGHKSEAYVDTQTQEILCRVCDEPAQRVISPVRCSLEGISGDFPTAWEKWGRQHEEATRVANKRMLDHGDDA